MTPSRIEIASAVWDAWQKQWDEFGAEFVLQILLVSPANTRAVADALEAAVAQVGGDFEQLPPREELAGNPPLFGHWEWVRTPAGVVVSVTDSDDFPLALERVVAAWQLGDIAGRLELADAAPVRLRVDDAVPIRTHIRVGGQRRRAERGGYVWEPDRSANQAVVRAICEWSSRLGPGAEYVLNAGDTGRMRWMSDDDVAEHVFDHIDRGSPVTFIAAVDGGGRMFRAEGYAGRVSLRAFGARVVRDAWRDELAALVALLRTTSSAIAYAFLARGRDGWPARPQDRPYGPAQTSK